MNIHKEDNLTGILLMQGMRIRIFDDRTQFYHDYKYQHLVFHLVPK